MAADEQQQLVLGVVVVLVELQGVGQVGDLLGQAARPGASASSCVGAMQAVLAENVFFVRE